MKINELYYIDSFEYTDFPVTEKYIQNFKMYYEKPIFLLKENDLYLIYSYSNKWKSYNIGWFEKNEDGKNFVKGQEIRKQYFNKNFNLISNLTLVKLKEKEGYTVEVVLVDERYRGKKLAQKMYYYFLKYITSPIISDSKLTREGKKLWISFYKSNIFDVKVINLKTNEKFDVELLDNEFYIKSSNKSLIDLNRDDENNKENIRLILYLK